MTPEGWEIRPLGELVERGGTPIELKPDALYREIGIRSHGKGIFHKEAVTGQSLGAKRVFSIEPHCLVVNIVFAWEGAVAVTTSAEQGMIASHRFPMLRPQQRRIDVDYLRRFFTTEQGVRLLGEASPGGAGRNRTLNQKFLAEIPVPVPPIAEQRKIAAILSSVDEAIEATQAVIDQLGIVKKAMMAELLTRGLPGRHTRFKQTEIGEMPEGWQIVSVQDIASKAPFSCVGGPFGSDLTSKDYVSSGVPVIRGTNLNGEDRWLREDGVVFVSEEKANELRRNIAYPGDVIFTQRGTLGQVARIKPDSGYRRFLLSQSQMKLSVNDDVANPDYVTYYFASPYGQDTIARATIATGIPHINLGILRAFRLPLPPMPEQGDLLRVFASLDARLGHELELQRALSLVKAALMSVLLTGELRVKPDEAAP